MNKAQRIALKLFGSTGEELERESRSWYLICPECGKESSYWDVAGIRAGDASEGKRVRIRCDRCQTRGWHDLVRRPEPGDDVSGGGPDG